MNGKEKGYGEFRAGWPVVLSSMLGIGLGLSPLPTYTIGIFARQLHQEFGWSFAQIFASLSITTVCAIVASPIVGILADRFGVRRVALLSLALFGVTFMGFGLSNGSLLLFYLNWGLVAALGAGTLPITWTRAINNWFEERKGLALGLSLLGSGLFGYLVKPFSAWVIAGYGWRGAYMAIGALPLLIALPVALVGFRDVGPRQETAAARKAALEAHRANTPGLTARETFAHWRFWVIALACVPVAFAVGGIIPNLENILKQGGFSPAQVVSLASLIGLSVIIGRVGGGWLIDRFWAPGVAFGLLGVPAWACWILAHGAHGYGVTALSVLMIGFAAGVEFDLMAFLVARYFGLKSYSVVYGALYSCFCLGAGSGPAVFGAAFDRDGTYSLPLTASAGMMVLGAALLLLLGRYPVFSRTVAGTARSAEAVAVTGASAL